jgi:predicted CxxxxCH...CXXCH cytochrome family protein
MPADCSGCHGGNAAASNTIVSGSHGKHISTYSFGCAQCHSGTVSADRTISSGGLVNHVDKSVEIVFGASVGTATLANNGGTYAGVTPPAPVTPGSANYSTCTNIYCHSDGNPAGVANRVYATTPQWGGGTTSCNSCHGTSNGIGSPDHPSFGNAVLGSNSHPTHAIASNLPCSECHWNTTHNDTTIASTAVHVNGTASTSVIFNPTGLNNHASYTPGAGSQQCSNTYCHGGGTPKWGGIVACGTCHHADNSLAGKHSLHYNSTTTGALVAADNSTASTYVFNCGTCHDNVAHGIGPANATIGQTARVVFNGTVAGGGIYNAGANMGIDTGGAGFNYTAGTCWNTYCHSNGKGGAPNVTAFNWNSPGGTLPCYGCHGYTTANGLTNAITSGTHLAHINGTSYGFSCSKCHDVTTTNGTSIANRVYHVNHIANVDWDSTNANGSAYSSPNCTNIYCHSQGQAASAPYSPGPFVNATWGTHYPGDCSGCHGGNASASNAISSGSHTTHMNSYSYNCGMCHAGTVSVASDRIISIVANHVDRQVEVVFNNAIGTTGTALANLGGTYNGVTPAGNSPMAPGTANYSTCSNIYCHSDANTLASARAYRTATWGNNGTVKCWSCHGDGVSSSSPAFTNTGPDRPGSNSHPKHILNGGQCLECHYMTTRNNTTIYLKTAHVNGTPGTGVIFNTAGLNNGGSYNAAEQCSNVYCHSNVQGANGLGVANVYSTPVWGDGAACDSCHGQAGHGTGQPSAGSHEAHAGPTKEDLSCNVCHNGAGDGTALHANQLIDLSLVNGSYSLGNHVTPGSGYGQCSNTQCHGAGSPTWGASTTNDTCTKCHGTPTPAGQVGVANRYVVAPPVSTAGTTGILNATNFVSNDSRVGAHQTHLQYFTGLRNATVLDNNDQRCAYCHGPLPTSGMHANGNANSNAVIAFQGLATFNGTMAANYNFSNGQCSNTYCHNPAASGVFPNSNIAGMDTAPTWTNAAYLTGSYSGGTLKNQTNCSMCHKVPGDTGFDTNHPTLTPNNVTADCSSCHGHNGDLTGSAPGTMHIDGQFAAAGGACDSCHSFDVVGATYNGTTGVWSGGTWGMLPHRDGSTAEGWGAHAAHINHLKTRLKIATLLNAAGNSFGSGIPAEICGTCHTNTVTNHQNSVASGTSTSTRYINFGDGLYQEGGPANLSSLIFGSTNPVYNGVTGYSSSVYPKTCSNVSCHYRTTPVWSAY